MHVTRLVLPIGCLVLTAQALPTDTSSSITSTPGGFTTIEPLATGTMLELGGPDGNEVGFWKESRVISPSATATKSKSHVFSGVNEQRQQVQLGGNPGTKKRKGHGHGHGHGKGRHRKSGSGRPKGSQVANASQATGHAHRKPGHGQGNTWSPGADSSTTSTGDGGNFAIHVVNRCSEAKDVGIFGVTPDFQATQAGGTQNIAPGQTATLEAPFTAIGQRLTANAQEGPSNVFEAQSLFEFGYSSWNGLTGTSYDLSLMAGAQIGMAVDVLDNGNGSGSCESKICVDPNNCATSQAWTDPDQVNIGSPADTTCYKGKTDFKVTLCPS